MLVEHGDVAIRGEYLVSKFFFFFFQAEDGIRDYKVTGVQTCALPIFLWRQGLHRHAGHPGTAVAELPRQWQIGRASCKGKSVDLGGRRIIKKKKNKSTTTRYAVE